MVIPLLANQDLAPMLMQTTKISQSKLGYSLNVISVYVNSKINHAKL